VINKGIYKVVIIIYPTLGQVYFQSYHMYKVTFYLSFFSYTGL
jgi:hypothetical protein